MTPSFIRETLISKLKSYSWDHFCGCPLGECSLPARWWRGEQRRRRWRPRSWTWGSDWGTRTWTTTTAWFFPCRCWGRRTYRLLPSGTPSSSDPSDRSKSPGSRAPQRVHWCPSRWAPHWVTTHRTSLLTFNNYLKAMGQVSRELKIAKNQQRNYHEQKTYTWSFPIL